MTLLANIRGQASDFFRPILANVRRILLVEPLGRPTGKHAPSVTGSSTEIVLAAETERFTMRAKGGDVMYELGTASQTAATSSHYLADGERMDLACQPGSRIALIRASGNTAATTVYISELE